MKKSVNQERIFITSSYAQSEERDRCVLCWCETEYSKDIPIKDRQFYIEGSGQLCEECYRKCF